MRARKCFYPVANMVRKIMPGTLGVLLMTSWFVPGLAEAEAPVSLALKVDYRHPIPVNLKKYGVDGGLLATPIGYGTKENELVGIYKQTGIVFGRYPGGTPANFYDWKTGQFSCNRTPNERFQERITQMNRSLVRTKTTFRVDDFFKFVKDTDGDFVYILNIMCDSPESNANLLGYMKKNNVNLKYVEMGNELDSGSYAWAIPNIEAYLDNAKKNYLVVKRYYPEAKISLSVSNLSFSSKRKPGKDGSPNSLWRDERAMQFDRGVAYSKLADALVIHLYGEPYDGGFWSSDPVTDRERYSRSMDQFNSSFSPSMTYLKRLGKGKPIWITEWGVTAPENKQQGVFQDYVKSAHQALFMASALVSITLEEGIEMANYHNASELWRSGKFRTEISPIGNVLGLFIDAAKKTDTVYSVQAGRSIGQNNQLNTVQENGIKSVLFTSSAGGDLFIINEQDKSYVINRMDMGNKKINNYSVDALYIENDVFRTTKGKQKNMADIGKAGIEIKPFSILRIRMY